MDTLINEFILQVRKNRALSSGNRFGSNLHDIQHSLCKKLESQLRPPFVHIGATAGAGKTRAVLNNLKTLYTSIRGYIVILVPTHKLANEIIDDIVKGGAFARHEICHYLGRAQPDPEPKASLPKDGDKPAMCLRLNDLKIRSDLGLDSYSMCKECPLREQCGSQRQKSRIEGGDFKILVGTHHMLRYGLRPFMSGHNRPGMLIIDETFEGAFKPTQRELSWTNLITCIKTNIPDLNSATMSSLETMAHDLAAFALGNQLNKEKQKAKWLTEKPGIGKAKKTARDYRNIDFIPKSILHKSDVWRGLCDIILRGLWASFKAKVKTDFTTTNQAELIILRATISFMQTLREFERSKHDLCAYLQVCKQKTDRAETLKFKIFKYDEREDQDQEVSLLNSNFLNVPILYLDATPPPNGLLPQEIRPIASYRWQIPHDPKAVTYIKVINLMRNKADFLGKRSTTMENRSENELNQSGKAEQILSILRACTSLYPSAPDVLFTGSKNVTEHAQALYETRNTWANVSFGHFGALAGLNCHKNTDILFNVGLNNPSPEDLQNMVAFALGYGINSTPSKNQELLRDRNGREEHVLLHHNSFPLIDDVQAWFRLAQATQAIGRGRAIQRKPNNPLLIIDISDGAVAGDIDILVTYDELIAGQTFWEQQEGFMLFSNRLIGKINGIKVKDIENRRRRRTWESAALTNMLDSAAQKAAQQGELHLPIFGDRPYCMDLDKGLIKLVVFKSGIRGMPPTAAIINTAIHNADAGQFVMNEMAKIDAAASIVDVIPVTLAPLPQSLSLLSAA